MKIKNIIKSGILLTFLLLLTACSSKNKVDVEKLIIVNQHGAEGHGYISLEPNKEYYEDLLVQIVNPKEGQDIYDKLNNTMDEQILNDYSFLANIEWLILNNENNLKNGDKVEIQFRVPEEYAEKSNLTLSKQSFYYKVKNLEKVNEFDPFEKLVLNFEGPEGYGKIVAEYPTYPDIPKGSSYEIDKQDNLSNGEIIKVKFNYDQEESIMLGFIAQSTEKEYTVSGLNPLQELKASELLENAKLKYEGASPFLTVSIDRMHSYPHSGEIYYLIHKEVAANSEVEPDFSVPLAKIGDKIVISIKSNKSLAENGYKLDDENATKTITIDENMVPVYAQNFDKISKGDALTLRNNIIDKLKNYDLRDNHKVVSNFSDFEFGKIALFTAKESSYKIEQFNPDIQRFTDLVVIFSTKGTSSDGTTKTYYGWAGIRNIILKPNGTYSYNMKNYHQRILPSDYVYEGETITTYDQAFKHTIDGNENYKYELIDTTLFK